MHPISRLLSRRQAPQSVAEATDPREAMDKSVLALLSNHYFFDDFERPDTTGSASPTNTGLGNGWQVTGSGYLTARITSGAFTADGNVYAWRQLPFTPARIAGVFRGTRSPLEFGDECVLITSVDANLFHNAIHIIFGPKRCLIQKRVANVSSSLTASVPLSLDPTSPHEFAYTVATDTVTVYVDGAQIAQVTDAEVSDLHGPFSTWQLGSSSARGSWEIVEASTAALA